MAGERHNGWTNWETWIINLHWSNEPSDYEFWSDRARTVAEEVEDHDEQVRQLATEMREMVEQLACEIEASPLVCDLLQGSFSDANWHEIAESWLCEARAESSL